jgi:hypothetical protein
MPQVIAPIDGYMVLVFVSHEHPPPHVHVRKDGSAMKILLHEIALSTIHIWATVLRSAPKDAHSKLSRRISTPAGRLGTNIMREAKRVKIIIPNAKIQEERQRAEDEHSRAFGAAKITYNAADDCFAIAMRSGVIVSIPRSNIEEFDGAHAADLKNVQIGIGDEVVENDDLDVHISLPGLLREIFGLNAGQREGGRSRSKAKIAASRANGAAGGRPRKTAAK